MTTTTDATDSPTASEVLEAALAYAALGWPIYPVYPVTDGGCAKCGPVCEWVAESGHPVLEDAVPDGPCGEVELVGLGTTDETTIRRLWSETPGAAVGFTPTDSVAVLVLLPQPQGEPLRGEQAWERLESPDQLRARVDYVLGPLDGIPSFRDGGAEVFVMETPIRLTTRRWSRCHLRGSDSPHAMYLLPSSLSGWLSPPTAAACPERLVAAFSAEATEEPDEPVLRLDVQAFQALAGAFEDIVAAAREVVEETGQPAPAHKIAKRLSGNNAKKYQRIRQAALHPDCALQALDGPRDTPVYEVATRSQASGHAA